MIVRAAPSNDGGNRAAIEEMPKKKKEHKGQTRKYAHLILAAYGVCVNDIFAFI